MKTAKNIEVVRRAMGQDVTGITVSTLKEADYFFEHGIRDILYGFVEIHMIFSVASPFLLYRVFCPTLFLLIDD